MEPLLRVEHLTVCYDGKLAAEDVSFSLKEGEVLGIVGESGSGKSTTVKAIMGLLGTEGEILEGEIWYKGQDLRTYSEKQMQKIRGKEIAMIFQDSRSMFCPVRKIGRQIEESVLAHEKVSRKEIRRRAEEIMGKIGLQDSRRILNSYPFELSGGMNQRIGICTAMMSEPALLLADEPTSALDVTMQKQVLEELQQMKQDGHMAVILVTHNIGVAKRMADQILVMKDGKIREYASAVQVLEHPNDPYTRELLDSVLRFSDGGREDTKECRKRC